MTEADARIRELEVENDRLKDALREQAHRLEVEATYWVPGSAVVGQNPYARQMHSALTTSAARLRAVLNPPQHCPEVARIIAESDRDTDYSPV